MTKIKIVTPIDFKSNQTDGTESNPFMKFQNDRRRIMNSVNSITTNQAASIQLEKKSTEEKAKITQDTNSGDTFEKSENIDKIKKYVLIGAGVTVAAAAYTAYTMTKFRATNGTLAKLVEPFKIIAARLNPNGYVPKADILGDEMEWLYDITSHLVRLKEKQQTPYLRQLYAKSNFSEKAKAIFEKHFGDVLV